MAEQEVVHVAIAPPTMLDEELVKKVSAIVAKTLYETRLRLTGKIPKIIANYYNRQMAESTARSLRELGLVAIVCTDSELRKPPQIYRAQTLKLEEPAMTFLDSSGQTRQMEPAEMFLIIRGRMEIYIDKEVTKTVKKLNVTATILMGGIPIRKKVEEKTVERSVQAEGFMRFYNRVSPEPVIEILQHDFDYSFLGAEMSSSSVANLNTTANKIKNTFPQAILDDRLVAPFGSDKHSAVPQENIDANCRLIYWYHQAVSKPGSSAQPQI